MLQRNLLYTGVTRGKKLVVLVGQKKVVAIAVRPSLDRRGGLNEMAGSNLMTRLTQLGCAAHA
jgi:exodeoxyribonuclease V alpha subunit